jgi:hypothetical protein
MPNNNYTMNFIIKILSIAFIFLLSFQLHAQSESIKTPQQCMQLIIKGLVLSSKGDNAEALELFIKAEAVARKNNWKKELFAASNDLGMVYNNLSNTGEAFNYYLKALKIANELGSDENSATVLTNIGSVFAEDDHKKALEYFNKAYQFTNTKQAKEVRFNIALNIADMYNTLGNYKEAQGYLKEVESMVTNSTNVQMWKINFAESLIIEGKLSEAKGILDKLLKNEDNDGGINPAISDNELTAAIYELLSKIYTSENNNDAAITYARKAVIKTQDVKFKKELYNHLSKLYFKNHQYGIAFQYKDSLVIAKDSLAALANRGLYESSKVRLKVQEYQNQLEVNRERQEAERKLFISGIVFCLLLLVALYRGLKNKITKQKQEKIIAENKNKIFDLEMESLKNNIAEKNRTLSAKALYLSGRNELIEEVINSLAHVPEVTQSAQVSEYISTLRSYLKTDDQWDEFIRYFEQVNPEFLKKLHTRHPQLTAPDVRFLCYVYMNLDVREIGSIFNITYNAAVKRLYRIKEKMELGKDASLYEYLLRLV